VTRPRGSYGIDAPYVPASFLATTVLALIFSAFISPPWGWWIVAAFFLTLAVIYLRTTFVGKFAIWRGLISALELRGDERAVDVGCGRGAVTVMLAEQLPQGHVDGVDLWRSRDQSGNAEARTRANLEANGVSDRVELHTANMLELPFAPASVDVVTASLSIHNLPDAADRKHAVEQAYRILRPGGRLIIADIKHVDDYGRALKELGADVRVRGAGPSGWWSAPWMGTTTLVATKAGSPKRKRG
jgi:arsenite methyltransferase